MIMKCHWCMLCEAVEIVEVFKDGPQKNHHFQYSHSSTSLSHYMSWLGDSFQLKEYGESDAMVLLKLSCKEISWLLPRFLGELALGILLPRIQRPWLEKPHGEVIINDPVNSLSWPPCYNSNSYGVWFGVVQPIKDFRWLILANI